MYERPETNIHVLEEFVGNVSLFEDGGKHSNTLLYWDKQQIILKALRVFLRSSEKKGSSDDEESHK